jgi:hypothetical protein
MAGAILNDDRGRLFSGKITEDCEKSNGFELLKVVERYARPAIKLRGRDARCRQLNT